MWAGAAAGGAGVAACAEAERPAAPPMDHDVSAPHREPLPPDQVPVAGVREFFTVAEASTVAAVVDRIVPPDDLGPGASEIGVVNYIDAKLARHEAYAEPTYAEPPFVETYQGSPPSNPPADVVLVAEDQVYRYGYQSSTPPAETYRAGLSALDDYARRRFGSRFSRLTVQQQDQLLTVLDQVRLRAEGDRPSGGAGVPADELDRAEEVFGEADPGGFFAMVRDDTIEGMFSDPAYGGNRGLAGWSLIGYRGPQREYSPREMKAGTRKKVQALDGLPPMNPGRSEPHTINPLDHPHRGITGE